MCRLRRLARAGPPAGPSLKHRAVSHQMPQRSGLGTRTCIPGWFLGILPGAEQEEKENVSPRCLGKTVGHKAAFSRRHPVP